MDSQLQYGFNLHGAPLTLAVIHGIVHRICLEGQVTVVGAQVDASLPARLFSLLSQRLGEEDKQWLRQMVREEVAKAQRGRESD